MRLTINQIGTCMSIEELNDRKSVNISNIDRLAIGQPQGFGTVQIQSFNPMGVCLRSSIWIA
jgi:hypothetical protein